MISVEDFEGSDFQSLSKQSNRASSNNFKSTSKQAWTDQMMSSTLTSSKKPLSIVLSVIGTTFVLAGIGLGTYYAVTNGKRFKELKF